MREDYLIFNSSVLACLLHPFEQIRAFDDDRAELGKLPIKTWRWLAGIAVFGSGIFGASLSLTLPQWEPTGGALWLILSAGLGWCFFGPTLVLVTGSNIFMCVH